MIYFAAPGLFTFNYSNASVWWMGLFINVSFLSLSCPRFSRWPALCFLRMRCFRFSYYRAVLVFVLPKLLGIALVALLTLDLMSCKQLGAGWAFMRSCGESLDSCIHFLSPDLRLAGFFRELVICAGLLMFCLMSLGCPIVPPVVVFAQTCTFVRHSVSLLGSVPRFFAKTVSVVLGATCMVMF